MFPPTLAGFPCERIQLGLIYDFSYNSSSSLGGPACWMNGGEKLLGASQTHYL